MNTNSYKTKSPLPFFLLVFGLSLPIWLIGMSNVSQFMYPNFGSYYDPAFATIITAIAAVTIAALWGSKALAQYKYWTLKNS